jgi:hypothetical protein
MNTHTEQTKRWIVLEPYTNRSVFPIGYQAEDHAIHIIAEVNSNGGTPSEQVKTARLIAAAPQLVQGLNDALDWLSELGYKKTPEFQRLKSIVAHAEGREM